MRIPATPVVPMLAVCLFWAAMLFGGAASAQALHDVHENAGVPCAACHQETPPAAAPPNATCVGCHGTMLETREGADALAPDPHRSPHLGAGEVPVCAECHSIHGQSEVTCVMCHRGFQFDVK